MASGTDIAKAYVQIIPSAEGIKGKLEDVLGGEAESAGKSAGGRFSKFFGTAAKVGAAAAGAVAAGVAAITKGAVENFAEYEQLAGGVEKIFDQANTTQIMADAQAAYKDLNMSANDYLAAINQTGAAFAQTMGDQKGYDTARQGMKAIADYASGTGRNLDELNDKYAMITRSTSSYQSIADQFSGILPATSADFLEQAQAAGLLSDSYKNLTEVPIAEYQEAVTQMLERGVDAMGLTDNTAKEATSTLSGSIATVKASWQNLLTAFADPNADLGAIVNNFIEAAGAALGNLIPVISQALSGISQVIVQLAPQIGAALPGLITTLLPDLTTAAFNLLLAFADGLVQNLPTLLDAALQMIPTIINGLTQALPQLISYVPQLVIAIAQTIIQNFPQIIAAGAQLVGALAQSILSLLGQMLSAGRQLLSSIVSGIRGAISSVVSIGKNIVQGIWQGISSSLGWIKDRITGWVGNVVNFLKKLFKIGSPSKLMRDEVGIYLAEGIGVGFEDGMTDVEHAMQNSMPDLQSMIQPVDVPVDFTATSGAALRGYAAVQTQNTPDPTLMDELRSIRRDLKNLRVYLDTGVLVGAVNSGLGSEYLATKRRALA